MTAARMSEARTSIIGAFLVALGPISMALYTPAMPELVSAFGTTDGMIKLTLSLYFGGFAISQLIAGSLSDAFGRKPVTMAFMAIYLIGSLMSAFAPTVHVLLAGRLIQGIGAAAGMTVSRAIVRDQFTGDKAASIMNLIGMMLAVGPALAPTIGSIALGLAGWRSIFFVMLGFSATACLIAYVFLEETSVPDRSKARIGPLTAAYKEVLTDSRFVSATLVIAGAVGVLYTLAAILPFILIDRVGLTPLQFGIGMLMQSGMYFAGSVAVRLLLARFTASQLIVPGLTLIGIGSAAVALSIALLPLGFLSVMVPVAVFAFGIAFITPSMMTAAIAPFPHIAGTASALMGFVQMGSGLVGGLICAAIGTPVLAMATVIPSFGLVSIISFLVYRAAIRAHPLLDADKLVEEYKTAAEMSAAA
ncbi:multidrug effflux MFS transporter [Rhizobium sp. KVB221]|uniref:Bcr/CflA family efflux transporter n=1 Tax=Rhizobium setariae TaxID=2801340 RepID=A0A936YWI6_9HYPH|nr:multidrug effflux MFS transporter [Rhizobium setariae]MBL0374670.1 multidrug effflux MFS transporter [Rhizobium setariae]